MGDGRSEHGIIIFFLRYVRSSRWSCPLQLFPFLGVIFCFLCYSFFVDGAVVFSLIFWTWGRSGRVVLSRRIFCGNFAIAWCFRLFS
jgi:hypothetical protein